MTNSINELEGSDVIFVTGSNTTEAHPQIARRIIKAVDNGATLIVADPRRTAISEFASIHLRLRPGTDIALLNAMMMVILSEGLTDDTFIEMRTENFAALRDRIYSMDFAGLASITGIKPELIRKAARLYAGANKGVICYCLGITQHICGTATVESIANLAMLAGHVEQSFTGVNPLRGQNNVQGACDMGALPGVFPGYQSVEDDRAREKFEQAWGVKLPEKPGLTLMEMTHGGVENGLRAMFIMGENPVMSDPDASVVEETLKKLDFLAVSDIFLTETAEFADVVFPAASFAEKTGTVTNSERRVQLMHRAIPPTGECRTDSSIIISIANLMGYEMQYESMAEVMEEIALLTPIYGGIYHDRLKNRFGLQWPCTSRSHEGTPYLHKYSFTRGKGMFVPAEHVTPDETPDEQYPFLLMTGRVYHHYHTGAMTRASEILSREVPCATMEMNSRDAKELGIRNGGKVKVRSRRGEMDIYVKSTDRVSRGMLYVPFHFHEAMVNRLTNPASDDIAKCPEYKVCAVAVDVL
jgi:formate dehydrogenase major subunit/formate dehydrogenase alpha subunit